MLDQQYENLNITWQNLNTTLQNYRIRLNDRYNQQTCLDIERKKIIKLLYNCGYLNNLITIAKPKLSNIYEYDRQDLDYAFLKLESWTMECNVLLHALTLLTGG